MVSELGVGQLLSERFEIVALVGRGGMSSVYEARDTVLDRVVAIKVFTVDSPDDRARLETEVRLLSRLRERTLVTVHDAFLAASPADGPSYLIMEFVDGRSLRDAIAERQLSAAEIRAVASDIGQALVAVHGAGIIHRDVKPANILLESGETGLHAKLADFGIAHLLDSTRLTVPGTVIGTAAYLSPEQAEGQTVAASSDIYSLGLVILESITRRREFPGTAAEALSARLARSPELPSSLPQDWARLLERMLAREPDARPTAVEVVAAAQQLGDEDLLRSPDPVAPTAMLATEDIPTRILPEAAAAPAAASQATQATAVLTRATTTTEPARRRPPLIVISIIVAAVVIVGAILLATRSGSPLPAHTGTQSPSVAPTTPVVVATPSTTPVPPTTVTGPGKGPKPGKGPGKGPGKP